MVRTITNAIYVQNSIFLRFLENEKITPSFFDIVYLCLSIVYLLEASVSNTLDLLSNKYLKEGLAFY